MVTTWIDWQAVRDTIDLAGQRFSIVGIYESKVSWEEMGGIMTLRDAQEFMGKPRKVIMYAVKLVDREQAVHSQGRSIRTWRLIWLACQGECFALTYFCKTVSRSAAFPA